MTNSLFEQLRGCRRAALTLAVLALIPAASFAGDKFPGILKDRGLGDRVGPPLAYQQWSANWYQWAFSMPLNHSPLFDTADCKTGQAGSVWFLAGAADGQPKSRNCTVPSGTSLFFPLINAEFSDLEQFGNTDRELRSQAQSAGNLILTDANKLFATLDGVPILNLAQYREESPLFNFGPLPPNNMITYFCVQQGEGCPAAPAGAKGISVADGVYLMLSPLSPGTHTLRFHAELDLSQFNAPNFKQDITYHLTVTP